MHQASYIARSHAKQQDAIQTNLSTGRWAPPPYIVSIVTAACKHHAAAL